MDLGTIVAEFTAKRVSAPDATGTARYRDTIQAYTFLGQRQTLLDLILQGNAVGVHLNGVHTTTLTLTVSWDADKIQGSYVSEPFPGHGFQITALAGHTFSNSAQTQGKPSKELPPGLMNIQTYQPKGTIQDGVYTYQDRSATLFTAADGAEIRFTSTNGALIPTAKVYGKITSPELSTKDRRNYQNKPRSLIEATTVLYLQCDGQGNLIDPSQRGKGKKFLLPLRIANLALCYLIDCGYRGYK